MASTRVQRSVSVDTAKSSPTASRAKDPKPHPKRVLPPTPADINTSSAQPQNIPPGPQSAVTTSMLQRSATAFAGTGEGTGASLMSQTSVMEAGSRLSTLPTGVPGRGRRDFVSPIKPIPPGEGEDSSVTVAVRVRPFSEREKRLEAKQAVRMHSNETIITSKEGVVHRFYYDHCFWSFDQSQSSHADQEKVYRDLAQPLLDRSFEGYNTCLFAYGQTGSGKSYCIMGEGEDQGIVPRFSKELYDRIEGTVEEQTIFNVQVSYYEIYNEKIYDLLASNKQKSKTKLRVREHPVMGPYVEDLSMYVATAYPDIERWINLGNRFRATAATGMNDRSSRSHSVFTIMLTQTCVLEGEEHSRVSRINLIDLAGSERSSIANTTGERLREGANINRSLHTLGKVISLLSERSMGKRTKVYIPYRDSTLTWLLKESLGGNSKTAMIATISPANLHHDESLSTLRYAHQARTIINVARINEDPNARIIRDLRQEIEALRSILGEGVDPSSSMVEIRALRDKLQESEKLMTEASRSWQEKLAETEARKKEEMEQLKRVGIYQLDQVNRLPTLVNLNEDPQLSEMLLYVIKEGVTTVGQHGPSSVHDIQLTGALVTEDHCSITNKDGIVTFELSGSSDAQTYINGTLITTATVLHHGDRVVVGGDHFFRFNHPGEVERGAMTHRQQGFEFARNELIRAQTARIEAELEEKRLREREQLMRELQVLREQAQVDIDQQRLDYEQRLGELEVQMQERTLEVSVHQRTKEEAESRMEELERKTQQLEEETLTQKHIIHLEKLKTEKEYNEAKEQKSRLMLELEQEKMKLEGDILKLNRNKNIRDKTSQRESVSLVSETNLLKGSELVRLAMMLQEASAICKNLSKPLIFSREDNYESGEPEVRVRVTNTQQNMITYWDLPKFESRLELMRDAYQMIHTGDSDTESICSSGTSDEPDPFYDPSDTWIKDCLITPHSSPARTAHLRRSLLGGSAGVSPAFPSPTSSAKRGGDPGSLIPKSLADVLSTSVFSRGASPAWQGTPDTDLTRQGSYHHLSQPLPRVCYDCISRILSMKEDGASQVSVCQRVLEQVWRMRTSCQALEEAFQRYSPTPDLNVPFSEMTEVRLHTVSLYTSLELVLEGARSLQEQILSMQGYLHVDGHGGQGFVGRLSLVEQTCRQLLSTICHQTALYCSKLLQAIDTGVEETLSDSHANLLESLDSTTNLVGQLMLERRVQERVMAGRLQPAREGSVSSTSDDFLSEQPYQKSAVAFYQGHCEWCVAVIENTSLHIQDLLTEVTQDQAAEDQGTTFSLELVNAIRRVVSTALAFLQRLAEMQAAIWNLEDTSEEEGTLPVTPNINHVVDMLLRLQQVQSNMESIAEQAGQIVEGISVRTEKLSHCNSHAALCCNELAASVLTVVKHSPCATSRELSAEVQSLSHEIARAVKTLNHLIKKGSLTDTRSAQSPRKPQRTETSLATGQVTHSSLPSPALIDDLDDVV